MYFVSSEKSSESYWLSHHALAHFIHQTKHAWQKVDMILKVQNFTKHFYEKKAKYL